MILYIYLASVAYCLYRFYKWHQSVSLDGVIGSSPAFDVIFTLIFAPIFVVVDTSIVFYKWITKYDQKNSQ